MNIFESMNRAFENKYGKVVDTHGAPIAGRSKLQESIDRVLEAISPEDQRDSDIIRDLIKKSYKRKNAALTPEEKEVMKKYGLSRTPQGDIHVGDGYDYSDYLDNRVKGSRFNKVNFADRARKAPQRKERDALRGEDGEIVYPIFNRDRDSSKKREAEASLISSKIDRMKKALKSRAYHDSELQGADDRYKAAIKAAEERREQDKYYHKDKRDENQKEIDNLLKRK